MTKESSLSLSRRIKNGDYEAFKELFSKCYAKSCHIANGILHDLEASRDIAQDIFLKVWENRNKIDPSKQIEQLIYVSTRNKANDFLRKKYTTNKYCQYLKYQKEHMFTRIDSLEANELETLINQAIQNLPQKTRVVFKLKMYRNLKIREISEKLCIPKQTINWHLNKAKEVLIDKISDYLS